MNSFNSQLDQLTGSYLGVTIVTVHEKSCVETEMRRAYE